MDWIERRLPEGDEVFLDHVGYYVPDMEAAASAFRRLGFAVSSQNTHYNADADGNLIPAGTVNRLITPDLGYVEILAASADTPLADQLRAGLKRYVGLHLTAFGHADVTVEEARLVEEGMELQPTVRLRRPIQTPEGERTVGFSVLRAEPGAMAEGRVQYCQHETPDLVWRGEYMAHENAVDALTDMLIVSGDPDEAVARYERFTGRAGRREGDLRSVPLDRGHVTFADVETAAVLLPRFRPPSPPFIAAMALRSADLAATRAALARNGVTPLLDTATVIAVGPDDGVGAHVLFHSADAYPIWPHLVRATSGRS